MRKDDSKAHLFPSQTCLKRFTNFDEVVTQDACEMSSSTGVGGGGGVERTHQALRSFIFIVVLSVRANPLPCYLTNIGKCLDYTPSSSLCLLLMMLI